MVRVSVYLVLERCVIDVDLVLPNNTLNTTVNSKIILHGVRHIPNYSK